VIDKAQVNGHYHAREEETETPAADQTGSPKGECVGRRIEKTIGLKKVVSLTSTRPLFMIIYCLVSARER
jgi:hypothetical protein